MGMITNRLKRGDPNYIPVPPGAAQEAYINKRFKNKANPQRTNEHGVPMQNYEEEVLRNQVNKSPRGNTPVRRGGTIDQLLFGPKVK